MSDIAIMDKFFKDVKIMTKEFEYFDARVKAAALKDDGIDLEYLYQHKNEIELLKKSTEILLQGMENDYQLRDHKGRTCKGKKVDSDVVSADSALLGKKVDSGVVSADSTLLEHPIQETECPNPTPSEHVDLSPSPKNVSDEEGASCSSA